MWACRGWRLKRWARDEGKGAELRSECGLLGKGWETMLSGGMGIGTMGKRKGFRKARVRVEMMHISMVWVHDRNARAGAS